MALGRIEDTPGRRGPVFSLMEKPMGDATPKRIAIGTGASRGIGKTIALRLAKDGRHVVLMSRTEGPLNDVKATIEANGGAASVVAVDISDAKGFAAAIEKVAETHGRL